VAETAQALSVWAAIHGGEPEPDDHASVA
jgi:hypothetical protein